MVNESIAYALRHVIELKELLEDLAQTGVELHEQSYQPLAFGSWTIVAGRRKQRYSFGWDGKDSYLSVSLGVASDSRSPISWKEQPELSGPVSSPEAMKKVRTILKEAYAV